MDTDELRYDGRVAVVTGSARGMGRAHARLLAARGAKVVINDLADAPVADVVAEIEADGGVAIASTDDISREASAGALIGRAIDAFGRIDILVNNAGFIHLMHFEDLHSAAFDKTMQINAYGPYYTAAAAWPHMLEQGYGRMVNVSSAAGLFGIPDRVDYGASKAAVIGMTRSIAADADGRGITANAVFPSAITRMSSAPQLKSYSERFGLSHDELLERTPGWVSVMVAWLAHEECAASGEIFEAGSGHYRRILIGATDGYEDANPTIEAIRDNFEQIVDSNGFETRPNFRTRAQWPTDDLLNRA